MSADPPTSSVMLLFVIGLCALIGIKSGSSKESPRLNPIEDGSQVNGNHVVEIDPDGYLKHPSSLKELFDNLAQQPRKRIVLYIHGGRVTLEQAQKRAERLTCAIQKTDRNAYPIFLNWEAGQGSSYFRHVAYERNGVSYRGSSIAGIAAIASPLVFTSDVGRGVSRLPINTFLSVGKLLASWDALVGRHDHFFPVKGAFDKQLQQITPKGYKNGFTYPATSDDRIPISISISMGHDAHLGRVAFAANYIATLPLQFGTEPLLDTFGTPAWNNMVRRTRSMFHPQVNYVVTSQENQAPRDGGAAVFFGALEHFMEGDIGRKFTLDIYAHSMGTMIVNEAFTEHPNLRVDHVIYMAAACSIRDFQNSAGRYIARHNTPFYNLSLHPRAERNEIEYSGIPVRGSLLVWVDEFFNQNHSFGDRTLGTFENAIVGRDLLPKGFNVHLKAFPVEDGTKKDCHLFAGPQKHNDFAKYYFWKPEFYNTDDANRYYPRTSQATPGE